MWTNFFNNLLIKAPQHADTIKALQLMKEMLSKHSALVISQKGNAYAKLQTLIRKVNPWLDFHKHLDRISPKEWIALNIKNQKFTINDLDAIPDDGNRQLFKQYLRMVI